MNPKAMTAIFLMNQKSKNASASVLAAILNMDPEDMAIVHYYVKHGCFPYPRRNGLKDAA